MKTIQVEYEQIPLSSMVRDERVQRPFEPSWGDWLAKHFDPSLVGVLEVSKRDDGSYGVMDGWHRKYALEQHGYTVAPCNVHDSLTTREEASRFVGLNTKRNVQYIDAFFSRVTALDEVAVDIMKATDSEGWEVSRKPGPGKIQAVKSLESLYKLKKDRSDSIKLVLDTLRVLTKAWGYEAEVTNGSVLYGVGLVINRYRDELDISQLGKRLASYPGGAAGLLGKSRALREAFRGSLPSCVAEIVVETYNSRRSTHRISTWRSK